MCSYMLQNNKTKICRKKADKAARSRLEPNADKTLDSCFIADIEPSYNAPLMPLSA